MTGRRPLVAALGLDAQGLGRLVVQRPDLHDLGPVLPVAIADEQQHRRAERPAVSDPAEDLGPVLLDRLTSAAAIALLAP